MNTHFNHSVKLALAFMFLVSTGIAKENIGQNSNTGKNGGGNSVYAGCNSTTAKTDLDINNVRAKIMTGGDMWWDLTDAKYEVPKGSGKTSIYAGALWIGGIDASNNLKLAAQTYRQTGNDFWAGPIDTISGTVDASRCDYYDRHWKVTKQDVLDYIATGTTSVKDITDWPGNGEGSFHEAQFLAPFFDNNCNGSYDPGDYPYYNLQQDITGKLCDSISNCNGYIFGDQTLWWVFNDVGNVHTETQGAPIGLEIRSQAFAFNTNDEINNMTFLKYEVVNRATTTLYGTYFGVWVDPDLGWYQDDYVGCDVTLGLGYVYNGDEDDEGAAGYGLNPPALGVDFFQGPLADPGDGVDNDRDGTVDEPGEQIIMSKFLYYNNVVAPNGNPNGANHFYNYLQGIWGDGQVMTYGGDGTDPNNNPCDFMFPGTTDPLNPTNWTEATVPNAPGDRRFLQSAGPFTLLPGAVNFITAGVVWARATSGGVQASINLMKIADSKAQSIFDNCFKVLDGPDAPNLSIRELDQQLIFSIENYNTGKVELYNETDPGIPKYVPNSSGQVDTLTEDEKKYKFQGYMIFQLKDPTVSTSAPDIYNPDKARLVAQFDVLDTIGDIVNNTWRDDLGFWFPESMVLHNSAVNTGIQHTIVVTKDYFGTGSGAMANNKELYYTIISYAYNNFRPFVPSPTASPNYTQSHPYFQGRLNIKKYSAIPHNPLVENNGQTLGSQYKTSVGMTKLDGTGNGGQILSMDSASLYQALQGPAYRSYNPHYYVGPLNVSVYDPVKVKNYNYELRLDGVADTSNWTAINTSLKDTIKSERSIKDINQQLFADYGIYASIYKVIEAGLPNAINNGFLTSSIQYANGFKWLKFLPDNNAKFAENWINKSTASCSNCEIADPNDVYEGVVNGTWGPFKLLSKASQDYAPKWAQSTLDAPTNGLNLQKLASVDVVITANKAYWTRCAVIEMCKTPDSTQGLAQKFDIRKGPSVDKSGVANFPSLDNDDFATGMSWFPGYAINIETGERLNMAFGENSHLDQDMKFNPSSKLYDALDTAIFGNGHFIYVFGHNGNLPTDVPRYDKGRFIRQFVSPVSINNKIKVYKDCMWASIPFAADASVNWDNFYKGTVNYGDIKVKIRVTKNYKNYETTPEIFANQSLKANTSYNVLVDTIVYNGTTFVTGSTFTTDANNLNFTGYGSVYEKDVSVNKGNPYVTFNTQPVENMTNEDEVAKSGLDIINIVPNPYYAYSSYEKNQYEQIVKITNLPANCTISIFTLNGTLIKKIKRATPGNDSSGGYIDQGGNNTNTTNTISWDLKNNKGIAVASGLYIIHVDAPGLGEKILKFFCVQRPTDVSIF